jgi:hypothetical protein
MCLQIGARLVKGVIELQVQMMGLQKGDDEDGVLGKWRSAKPGIDYELVLTLRDGLRRFYTSRTLIPAEQKIAFNSRKQESLQKQEVTDLPFTYVL